MTEPTMIQWGRSNAADYPAVEYADALHKAFIDRRADFITLDSSPHGQRFRAACAAWAIDCGWLYCSQVEDDGQCEVAAFRLTEVGREELSKWGWGLGS